VGAAILGQPGGDPVTLRVGALSWVLAPRDIPLAQRFDWVIQDAPARGLDLVGGDPRPIFDWASMSIDLGHWAELRAQADAQSVEIEPYIRSPFDVLDNPAARGEIVDSMRAARVLGGPYVRTAYGYLWRDKSRFSRREPVAEHMRRLVCVLREVARIAEGEGVQLAIENHVDFTGPEWARMIADVDSEAIRSGFDTGNALALFADPAADIDALAPWAASVQVKDFAVVESGARDILGSQPPFRIAGCALGDGDVDVAGAVNEVLRRGPRGRGTPFIAEISWPLTRPGSDAREVALDMLTRSVAYLRAFRPAATLRSGPDRDHAGTTRRPVTLPDLNEQII
jgi:sugar phosphate isomerase/epimerase